MLDFAISIAAFLVAIGVIVTVHEFGHYAVARICGVRVLRFSVGFGRALWQRTLGRDQTQWVVAAVPLGGYVKMLDENEVEVAPEERHRAFNTQTVGTRAAIVAAGPAINVVLAIVAYTAMFVIGVQGVVPRIGGVEADSPAAQAGFQRGDRIVAIDGQQTPTWSEVRLALLDRALGTDQASVPVTVKRSDVVEEQLRLNVGRVSLAEQDADPVSKLGLERWFPDIPPKLGRVVADSPAQRAGLQPGDRILRAKGTRIEDWRQWVEFVRARPGQRFEVTIMRDGQRKTLQLKPRARERDGRRIGHIGAAPEKLSPQQRDQLFTTVRYGPLAAFGQGLAKTWEVTELTGRLFYSMVTGQASLTNISGPITIGRYAGQSVQIGLATFLGFIALISVSIGLVNLLPIPVLDGGHLLYYAIEAIKGSPVSEKVQAMGQQVGIALLIGLMSLALYNDFLRLVN